MIVSEESKSEPKTLSRVERLNEAGIRDYFMPVDLSEFPKSDIEMIFPQHPLEQFEQIFSDLIVKEIIWSADKQKAWHNYMRQIDRGICRNCLHDDESGRTCNGIDWNCRVYKFKVMSRETLIRSVNNIDKEGFVTIRASRLRKIWKNRMNWKKRGLGILDALLDL